MKFDTNSDQVKAFYNLYNEKDGYQTNVNGVHVFVAENIETGNLRSFIDIGEKPSHDHIRTAISMGLKWRDAIEEFQGLTGAYEENWLLIDFAKDIKFSRVRHAYLQRKYKKFVRVGRFTYGDVISCLNWFINSWLYEFSNEEYPEKHNKPNYYETFRFHTMGFEERVPNPRERAQKVVMLFAKHERKILVLDEIIEKINAGLYKPKKNYPISKLMFRRALKPFQEHLKKQKK